MFDVIEETGSSRTILWSDRSCGLRAILVIDDLTLGPGAGGVRTAAYPSLAAALRDAGQLAGAMTLKCALAGLDTGGAKAVVLDHAGLDRPGAFARLGEFVEELGGLFRTAGDLGTTSADLCAMASTCQYVHADEAGLVEAVALGMVECLSACATVREGAALSDLHVAVQGCGAIGAAVSRALSAAGVRLTICDVVGERATTLAAELDATVCSPAEVLQLPVDIIAPCAVGGVIDTGVADSMRAWGLCGAANNIVADGAAVMRLQERGVTHVPDVVASAGAVVEGIGRTVMALPDRLPLIRGLGATALELLEESRASGRTTVALARQRAHARLGRAAWFCPCVRVGRSRLA